MNNEDKESLCMDEVCYLLKGFKSELLVYDNRVIIILKGDKNNGASTYKCLSIRDIIKINIVPESENLGSIEFFMKDSGNFEDSKEYYKITFNLSKSSSNIKQNNLYVFEIKSFIEDQIIKNQTKNKLIDILSMDSIRKASELLKEGIITQEEFDAKKKQLLGL